MNACFVKPAKPTRLVMFSLISLTGLNLLSACQTVQPNQTSFLAQNRAQHAGRTPEKHSDKGEMTISVLFPKGK